MMIWWLTANICFRVCLDRRRPGPLGRPWPVVGSSPFAAHRNLVQTTLSSLAPVPPLQCAQPTTTTPTPSQPSTPTTPMTEFQSISLTPTMRARSDYRDSTHSHHASQSI